MRAPNQPDLKLFWSMMGLGALCFIFGGMLGWAHYAGNQQDKERSMWVEAQAAVYEIGVACFVGRRGASYFVIAHYVLHANGRDYQGSGVAVRSSSMSAEHAKALILPYAPEAAAFNFEDLGLLNPQRTWHVVYTPAPARYDPRDPAQSEIVLESRGAAGSLGWIGTIFIASSLLAGFVLWVFAWPAARGRGWGKKQYKPPVGPELWKYPAADRGRMLQSVEKVHAEILRLSAAKMTGEQRYYADRIADMAAEARAGTMMPRQYTGLHLGRGADEVFGDERLAHAAFKLQDCIDDLVARPPGSGRAIST